MIEIVDRVIKAAAMGGALFAVILIWGIVFDSNTEFAVALPVGVASLWYLAETWRTERRSRRSH